MQDHKSSLDGDEWKGPQEEEPAHAKFSWGGTRNQRLKGGWCFWSRERGSARWEEGRGPPGPEEAGVLALLRSLLTSTPQGFAERQLEKPRMVGNAGSGV